MEREPLWEAALQELLASKSFGYGHLISWTWLEKRFHSHRDSTRFLGEYLSFQHAIRSHGFILTERGTDSKGVRTLNKAEMAQVVASQEARKIGHTFRNAQTLSVVDTSDMAIEDRERHEHWTLKCLHIAQKAARVFRMRSLPPIGCEPPRLE